MNERFKEIRLSLKLTQEEYGDKIGIKSRAHISALESGKRTITDRIISDVCREFNVNEDWLRSGVGDMFNKLSKAELVADVVGNILKSDDEFIQNVFIALGQMSSDEWDKVKDFVNKIKSN